MKRLGLLGKSFGFGLMTLLIITFLVDGYELNWYVEHIILTIAGIFTLLSIIFLGCFFDKDYDD